MITPVKPLRDGREFDYAIEGPRSSRFWDRRYLLALYDVTAVFDGFKALDITDLGIVHNELRVVVGPNGAGKTTMCDVISGLTKPASGHVHFDGAEITGLDEATIAQAGIGRKFQIPNVFDSLTVWENLLLSLPAPLRTREEVARHLEEHEPRLCGPAGIALYRMWHALRHVGGKPSAEQREQMEAILRRVHLIDHRNTVARRLSHGQRQWLAISRLILNRPKLLLVDEPAAGLSDQETRLTAELLNELKGEHTLVVIEHDMEFVRALDSRVTVLNEGKILADGSLDEVQGNEAVIEAYLGR